MDVVHVGVDRHRWRVVRGVVGIRRLNELRRANNRPPDRSKIEIERTLMRYGADSFSYGWDGEKAYLGFRMNDRLVKFVISMPAKDDPRFLKTDTGRPRKADAALKEWQQSINQRWRALALVVKAKLESVESGIASFEEEFLAHIVLPDGSTVGNYMLPQIKIAYDTRKMPKLLPFNNEDNHERESKR